MAQGCVGGDTVPGRTAQPDTSRVWKRDDGTRSGLQDAVNRTRDELRRSALEGQEPPPRTELQAPEIDHAAIRTDLAGNSDAATQTDLAPNSDATIRTNVDTEAESAALGLHPFFQGLLEALPEPGTNWPPVKREQWLETARNIFTLIYGDPSGQGEGTLSLQRGALVTERQSESL